jgi:hypothetical protein
LETWQVGCAWKQAALSAKQTSAIAILAVERPEKETQVDGLWLGCQSRYMVDGSEQYQKSLRY